MRRLVAALALAVAAGLAGAPGAHADVKWLCKPGLAHDPCTLPADTARYAPDGRFLGHDDPRATRRRIDCFYVYPTVSDQPRPSASLAIDPELRSIARYQAARYSRTCRVFAPVYRQVTLAGLGTATAADWRRALADVKAAWRTYLRRFNHGRGVVLIGHSQGTFHLRDLLRQVIEPHRAQRRKLVSALLLGGNVTVAAGRDTGGDLGRLRACRSAWQTRCVIAFSTFDAPVPADAAFGRSNDPHRQVLCTNPAALGGGAGRIDAIVPSEPIAPGTWIAAALAAVGFPFPASSADWIRFPGAYEARCSSAGGAHVLQVTPRAGAPVLTPVPAPTWGLHLVDANLALGQLDAIVRRQAAAYRARR
jgi:hypothetical protein